MEYQSKDSLKHGYSNTEKKLTLLIRLENILEKCVFKVKIFAVSEVKGK